MVHVTGDSEISFVELTSDVKSFKIPHSSFEEIFDVEHFIDALKDDISIVKELPYEYSWSTREFYATAIRETRVKTAPVHASVNWYIDNVLPIIKRWVVYICFLTIMLSAILFVQVRSDYSFNVS